MNKIILENARLQVKIMELEAQLRAAEVIIKALTREKAKETIKRGS